jgi:hypothetical protein
MATLVIRRWKSKPGSEPEQAVSLEIGNGSAQEIAGLLARGIPANGDEYTFEVWHNNQLKLRTSTNGGKHHGSE